MSRKGATQVTVLMTVYNDERHVGAAIESILAQTYRDFELLIVDDGSTDRTAEILAGYAEKDGRVIVHTQENAGTTAAANRGLSEAGGKYIARLDSDDIAFPHRLKTEVEYLDEHPEVGLVGGGLEIIDEDGAVVGVRSIHASPAKPLLWRRTIYQQSDVMFRKDAALKAGGYREKFHNAQDYDLWLRISEVSEIAKLDDIFGQWRMNAGGYTLSRMKEQRDEFMTIRRFAEQRRDTGSDDYESYTPTPPAKPRATLPVREYDLLVAKVLLQSGRPSDARARILLHSELPAPPQTNSLLLLTCAPKLLLRWAFAVRDYYLNHLA